MSKYIPSLQKRLKAMHFHIVKMYKDKEVKKNIKNICLSMCDVKMFLTFTFTEYGTVLFLFLNTVMVTAGDFEP